MAEPEGTELFEIYISHVQKGVLLFHRTDIYYCDLPPVLEENGVPDWAEILQDDAPIRLETLRNLRNTLSRGVFFPEGLPQGRGEPLLRYAGTNPGQTQAFNTRIGVFRPLTGPMFFLAILQVILKEGEQRFDWLNPRYGAFYEHFKKYCTSLQFDPRKKVPALNAETAYDNIGRKGRWRCHCSLCIGEEFFLGKVARCGETLPARRADFANLGDMLLEIILSCSVAKFYTSYSEFMQEFGRRSGALTDFIGRILRRNAGGLNFGA